MSPPIQESIHESTQKPLTDDPSRFGVEFAPAVVRSDGNIRNLAWRICNAKKVLVSSFGYLQS